MAAESSKSEIDWTKIREETLQDFTLAALPPTLELPALPHAVTQFVQKAKDPKVTVKELSAIIATDTGLTVELLRHVNSSFMGLRHKAGNVQQALTLLGQRQSKSFVITTGTKAAVRARKSRLINQGAFWNASLQKALFAQEVAGLLKADPMLAFSGALLQDYLLPVVTNELLEAYIQFVDARHEQPVDICEFERGALGWDHATAAASLAHRWHLPDDLVCCILFHHYGLRILAHPELKRSAAAAVALSALLPDQLRQHLNGLDILQKLEQKWGAFSLQDLAETVDRKQEELGLGVRNDFPLARRCRTAASDAAAYNDGTLNKVAVC